MIYQRFEDILTDANAQDRRPGPPVRIAVCGEVSSGKSTVVNTLLRDAILPDNIGAHARPVIEAGFRAQAGVEVTREDGSTDTFGSCTADGIFRNARHVRLWSSHPHMAGIEIVEVPLTKAEDLTPAQIELIGACDMMIWVTIASQAWRLTEKTILEQLGPVRPAQGLLAITRADKLRSDGDRARLLARVERETHTLFDRCLFIHGARQTIDQSATSHDAWTQTGGPDMLSTIIAFADRIRTKRAKDLPEDLDGPAGLDAPMAETAQEDPTTDSFTQAAVAEDMPHTPTEPPAAESAPARPERSVKVVDFSVKRAARSNAKPAEIRVTTAPNTQNPADPSDQDDIAPDTSTTMPARSDLDAVAALRRMVNGMDGVLVGGLRPLDPKAGYAALKGDDQAVNAVGTLCEQIHSGVADAFAPNQPADDVHALNLAVTGHRILSQLIPNVGLLFLMLDAETLNQGTAQRAISHIHNSFAAGV